MKIRNRFKVLFLVFVVLGVYYPAIFGKVNSVDDWQMLASLQNTAHFGWKQMFWPGNGFYYRPILSLTFWGDKLFWGLSPSFMHLENILIHALNTVLVFFVARKVFAAMRITRPELPFLSALVFALHPICTESINWISGRTDPLATIFVLVSILVMIRGLEKDSALIVFGAALVYALGILSKEMMVFFLPAGLFLIWRWPQQDLKRADPTRKRLMLMLVYASPLLISVLAYIIVRQTILAHHATGLSDLLARNHYDLFNAVRVFFKAFGFYVKKLFLPIPLNFAIVKVSNQYVWLGIASFLWWLYMVRRRSPAIFMLVIAFYQILPAIIIALANVAWTPLAERYLYLPSAFFAVGVVGVGYRLLERWGKELVLAPTLGVILIPSAVVTVQRNLVWQNNISLYRDTLKKSPSFDILHNELGIALLKDGQKRAAEVQFQEGIKKDSSHRLVLPDINLALWYLDNGQPQKARSQLIDIGAKSASAKTELLNNLIAVDERLLMQDDNRNNKNQIINELIGLYSRLYERTRNPIKIYRCGQLALHLREKRLARECFAKAYKEAPDDAFYKLAAKKMTEKLSGD